jgi:hypothetical protein
MQCDKCKTDIPEGEEKKHSGRILCEDCYMDALSPLKPCDPWAVYSATTAIKQHGHDLQLPPIQQQILHSLRQKGPAEPDQLCVTLHISKTDMERELAVLRHMEKIRGQLRDGKRIIRLWDQP